jgi:hypothetical protein
MAEPLRHRQTKEAATDMFSLKPPRHISTLLIRDRVEPGSRFCHVCYALKAEAKSDYRSLPRWELCRLIKSFQSIQAASLSKCSPPAFAQCNALSHAASFLCWAECDLNRQRLSAHLRAGREAIEGLDDFCHCVIARRGCQFVIAAERGLRGQQFTRRLQERIDAFRQFGVAHERECSASRRPSKFQWLFPIFLIKGVRERGGPYRMVACRARV